MNELKITGGARIGKLNATYPFATLKVSKNKLVLNASVIGKLVFQPSDIISIEPYTEMPILGKGIKINHNVSNYKEKVIFWTMENPKRLLSKIRRTGFLDSINSEESVIDDEIVEKQRIVGSPFKKSVIYGYLVIWNLLFLTAILSSEIPFFYPIITAFILVIGSAVLTLVSSGFREIVLKEGRELEDVNRYLYLLIFISSVMMLGIIIAFLL